MKGSLYTVFYVLCLGAVSAGMLTGVGTYTRPFAEANEEAERVRNILGVLRVPLHQDAGSKELVRVFEEAVRKGSHKDLLFHAYVKDGSLATAAFEFKGQGVWGPIEGFLALGPDLVTVSGVTFHKQEETPGLGGEIASDGFRKQFEGKSIRRADGSAGIRLVKGGGSSGPSEVDAISGATMTCQKVEGMLNAFMANILANRDAVRAALERVIREGQSDAR
ncbi:MAG: FMN-binding protein [Planctomycetota bacterium]|jgi:Na+-transporting NADH:ubiquinone oxidoreductase subunit C